MSANVEGLIRKRRATSPDAPAISVPSVPRLRDDMMTPPADVVLPVVPSLSTTNAPDTRAAIRQDAQTMPARAPATRRRGDRTVQGERRCSSASRRSSRFDARRSFRCCRSSRPGVAATGIHSTRRARLRRACCADDGQGALLLLRPVARSIALMRFAHALARKVETKMRQSRPRAAPVC